MKYFASTNPYNLYQLNHGHRIK